MKKAEKKKISRLSRKLKGFRDDFIRGAIVSGDCRAKSIPDEFKPENLPDDFDGRCLIIYGDKQHILTFSSYTDTKENFERLINNTVLTDYEVMLYKIYQWSNEAVWLVRKSEHADLLNEDARCIYKSWESLSAEMSEDEKKDIRDIVGLDIVESGGNPWSIKSNVELFHIKRLNEIIANLASKQKKETENPADSKCRRIWIWLKKIPHWIYYILGTLAALLTILHLLGWLEPIKRLFSR